MAFESSFSQNLDNKTRGGTESKTRLKKLRSIKLSKFSSSKPSARPAKSRFDWPSIDLSNDDIKATNCSDAKKESSQGGSVSEDTSVSSSTYRSVASTASSLNQDSSIKGGIERKKTLKKSRSNKLKSFGSFRQSRRHTKSRFDRPSVILPDDGVTPQQPSSVEVSDASPNYLKETSCSDGRKLHFQASPRNSESSFDSSGHGKSSSYYSQLKSVSSSQKSMKTFTRTSSLRPVRIFRNKTSSNSKRPSTKKCAEISQDLSINKATCSSTLKDLRFPEQVELHPGESESERLSVLKVCRYHHCSLHGHCHTPEPPPKRFLYKRRRSLPIQKSMKMKSQSTLPEKRSGNRKKEFQTSPITSMGDPATEKGTNASIVTSLVGDDKELDFSVEVCAKTRVQSFRGERQENEDADLAEILFGETSYPEKSLQENLNQIRNFPAEEQHNLETLTERKEASLECGCIETKPDKSISEVIDVDLKGEEIVMSNLGNNNISTITVNQFDCTDSCSPTLSLKPDDKVSTCSEEVPNLNSELGDDKLSIIAKGSTPTDFGEATEEKGAISTASNCHPLEKLSMNRQEKNGDSEPNSEFHNGSTSVRDSDLEGSIPSRDSEDIATGHEAYKPQFQRQNHISMWHLIHKRMVSGLAAEAGTDPLWRADEEKQLDDVKTLTARNNSDLCPDLTDPDMSTENHYTVSQELELCKIFAIKLVREAIEKILLPEVPDQSSDDQSITSDVISDQQLLEEDHGEVGELSISTSTDSAKKSFTECDNNKVADDTSFGLKGVSHADNSISGPEEEKLKTKVGSIADKQAPKSWSYLKKFILLKRFIKELEKVRKFNPRKPRHLPLEPEPEAEKVSLRHQMTGDKKSAEEWMLDYALRQVVSQLAPTQKRKVALLVKAFETVVPNQEDEHIQMTVPKLKDSSKECCIKGELDESVTESNDADWKAGEVVSTLDRGDKSILAHKQSDVSDLYMPAVKDSQLCNNYSLKSDDIVSCSSETMPVDQKAQEVPEDVVSSLNSKLPSGGSESSGKILEQDTLGDATGKLSYITNGSTTNNDIESNAMDIIASTPYFDSLEQVTAAREEKNRESRPEHVVFRGISPLMGSKPDCTLNEVHNTKLDKQNHIRMWHMIYQHVVSGIAAKVGSRILIDGADEEQVDDANLLPEVKATGSCHDYSKAGHDADKEYHDTIRQRIEFSQSDAVKLVQEAVDEILLPEIQDDSSDTQSIASDIVPDQELLEKSHGDAAEVGIFNSTDSVNDSLRKCDRSKVEEGISLDQEEKGSADDAITTPEEKRATSVVRNKSEEQKPKNWSKLKKLVLLKRSIRALEKVRKLSSEPPQQLPLNPDPEAEKVDLRRQMTDERKKAEQWMLDYAVQHIVTKLTPARKRRVAMLVEAFEAVVPLPEI